MSQYILINRLKVQNANAIAGFTWGFPAITHFLGFTHNLERKIRATETFSDITLAGCAVIAHEHHVHTYGKSDAEFTQNRNPPYLPAHDKGATPPVVEEGKMNLTVSLLIACNGNIGNRADDFIAWLERVCLTQRLAGGTILNPALNIELFAENEANLRLIKRKLLPGFVLLDRSDYLQAHYQSLSQINPDADLLAAWMDFAALKRRARPKSDLIEKHLLAQAELAKIWQQHSASPYERDSIPAALWQYFANLTETKSNKNLLQQWQHYLAPDEKTDADWEYVPKPQSGYLVPIMTGYKAISSLYEAGKVANTRDNETPVCFVESVHSIGEWQGIHRVKSIEQLNQCFWRYDHEEHWYLCKQSVEPLFKTTVAQLEAEADTAHGFY